jgi:hypothetical protein
MLQLKVTDLLVTLVQAPQLFQQTVATVTFLPLKYIKRLVKPEVVLVQEVPAVKAS